MALLVSFSIFVVLNAKSFVPAAYAFEDAGGSSPGISGLASATFDAFPPMAYLALAAIAAGMLTYILTRNSKRKEIGISVAAMLIVAGIGFYLFNFFLGSISGLLTLRYDYLQIQSPGIEFSLRVDSPSELGAPVAYYITYRDKSSGSDLSGEAVVTVRRLGSKATEPQGKIAYIERVHVEGSYSGYINLIDAGKYTITAKEISTGLEDTKVFSYGTSDSAPDTLYVTEEALTASVLIIVLAYLLAGGRKKRARP